MANPTYQSGFYAPGRGTALHPELWDGCVGAWNPGLGNTGLSLRDWSGNQNNGTLTNGPTWGVSDGRQALNLDGTNDYVRIGTALALSTSTAWAIGAWGKLDADGERSIFGDGILFARVLRHTSTQFIIANDADNLDFVPGIMPLNTWTHVLVVSRGDGVNIDLYLNGAFTGTYNNGGTFTLRDIGRGYTAYYWDGGIADVRVYNRVVSPNEIRTLAQRPGIAYELAPRKFYSLPAAAAGNPTGILINNLQSIRLGL